MLKASIDRAAELLLEVRRNNDRLDSIPHDIRPADLTDAYAVQDRLFELLETKSVGWFLGGTNDTIYLPVAYRAPILREALLDSPASLSEAKFGMFEIDVEFGFTFRADVPARKGGYTEKEVLGFLSTIHPAFDVVNSHFKNLETVDWPSIVADMGTDGAVVRGKGIEDWDPAQLADHPVALTVNGEQVLTGSGSRIMGNPVNAIVWFVNHMSDRGELIKQGEFLATGSCTDIYHGRAGDFIEADFGHFGTVTLTLTE